MQAWAIAHALTSVKASAGETFVSASIFNGANMVKPMMIAGKATLQLEGRSNRACAWQAQLQVTAVAEGAPRSSTAERLLLHQSIPQSRKSIQAHPSAPNPCTQKNFDKKINSTTTT